MKCQICKTQWTVLYAHVAKVKDGRRVCQCPECGNVAPLEECVEKEEALRIVPSSSDSSRGAMA